VQSTSSFLFSSLSPFHFLSPRVQPSVICSRWCSVSPVIHINVILSNCCFSAWCFRVWLTLPHKENVLSSDCYLSNFSCVSFSILKMFSDKKRVETALEQCGLVNHRVLLKSDHWAVLISESVLCVGSNRCSSVSHPVVLRSILCRPLQCKEGTTGAAGFEWTVNIAGWFEELVSYNNAGRWILDVYR